MKGVCCCLLGISLVASCGSKQPRIDKTYEEGVEVVFNHLEPYLLPGVPSALKLEEDFSIDTESEEATAISLFEISDFSVDSEGNIYVAQRPKPADVIIKFDRKGKYLASFGRKGQGPGEFESSPGIEVDGEDHLFASDVSKRELFVFDREGTLIREIRPDRDLLYFECLGAKKYLLGWQTRDPEKGVFRNDFAISSESMDNIKEFQSCEFEDAIAAPRYNAAMGSFAIGASATYIYFGDSNKGYEILVFDLNGNLVRKIRKEFRPVPVSDEYKELVRKLMESRGSHGKMVLAKMYWPSHKTPFRKLFTDTNGRLYVMTNEREGERTYWYDIFTSEGVFFGRTRLDNVKVNYYEGKRYDDRALRVMARGDRLYCLREKDSGYVALTIYKMKWN
ncbi:MAG: 6-bladed beta-propeller [Candidatus Aminicenantes bacterium]|nr:6-bladed beta-propeller [Candidatus Aminicenantes bacterium]